MKNKNKLKILVVGDLHGKIPEIHYKDYDIVVAPGDFCSDKIRKYMFQSIEEKDKGGDKKWWEIIGKKEAEKENEKSLQDGRKILQKLNSLNKPVYIIPGNWDWMPDEDSEWGFLRKNHFEELIKGLKNIMNIDMGLIDTPKIQLIGYGEITGPEYPQTKKDKERYNSLELEELKGNCDLIKQELSKLFEEADKKKPLLFLGHNVPYNTKLDKIKDEKSPRYGEHFGSIVVRDLIEKYNPELFVGGHMHEHFGEDKIGKTIVINAGFGPEYNTLIEVENKKVKNLEFWPEKY